MRHRLLIKDITNPSGFSIAGQEKKCLQGTAFVTLYTIGGCNDWDKKQIQYEAFELGIKAQNGIYVFENDMIKFNSYFGIRLAQILYFHGEFVINICGMPGRAPLFEENNLEVIGNIHDGRTTKDFEAIRWDILNHEEKIEKPYKFVSQEKLNA